ncbi:hypothetical protein [Corynebacterium lowii]|uniref:hypothetical protein n=1 Tax=Corynebacterium lowii TaxID=1544413 RepID=UPI0006DCB4DB|nr:hypothetical protein [Corynebacterium lowii]MDP9851482.1 hypothetical protein [Corynebacterium lowii]
MFKLFGRRKKKAGPRPPRAPGATIRPDDAQELRQWAQERAFVEAFVEPETFVNEMSAVVVDESGDFIRRRIGGPKGIDALAKLLDCPVYDVEETGYPQRMRERIERDRLLRKREEQRQRRAQLERDEENRQENREN